MGGISMREPNVMMNRFIITRARNIIWHKVILLQLLKSIFCLRHLIE